MAEEKLKNGNLPIDVEVNLLYQLMPEPIEKRDDWPDTRKSRSDLWLRTWEKLNKLKDQDFDPKDVPELNVSPPKETMLPPGVSPESIDDDDLRKVYEAAIEKNRAKAAYYNQQFQIRQIEDRYKEIAREYLTHLYSKAPSNDKELSQLLEKFIPEESERKRIMDSIKH